MSNIASSKIYEYGNFTYKLYMSYYICIFYITFFKVYLFLDIYIRIINFALFTSKIN